MNLDAKSAMSWVGSVVVLVVGFGLFEWARRRFLVQWNDIQVTIEKHIQQDAAIAPPFCGKACSRLQLQRMAVSEHIDTPMQTNRGLDIRRPLPGQRPLDEIAIQAAQQLGRRVAAEV